jgi:hypothetical protein
MANLKNVSKARKKVELRRRDWIPVWLYLTLSLVIPLYGLLYYALLKDKDPQRSKIALTLAIVGGIIYLLLKLMVWLR